MSDPRPTRPQQQADNPYSLNDWLRLAQHSMHIRNRYAVLAFWVIAGIAVMMLCAFAAEMVRWIGGNGILTIVLLPLALVGCYQIFTWWRHGH